MKSEEFDQYIINLLNIRYQGMPITNVTRGRILHTIIEEATIHLLDFDPSDSPYVVILKESNLTIFKHLPGVVAPICIKGRIT